MRAGAGRQRWAGPSLRAGLAEVAGAVNTDAHQESRQLRVRWTNAARVSAAIELGTVPLPPLARTVAGVGAGVAIGIVAALMGVAGGELLIPTIVLLYGIDIKLAGSLSLAVSLPTMLVAFARYRRDRSFQVLRANATFVAVMAAGSITGTVLGGLLLGIVPNAVLIPVLVAVLVLSAVKVGQHA